MQGIGNYTKAEAPAVKKSVGIHGEALGMAILVNGNYLLPTTAETRQVVGCTDDIRTSFFQVGTER